MDRLPLIAIDGTDRMNGMRPGRVLRRSLEPLEPRTMLSGTVVEHGDVAYFFIENDPRVERYDISHEAWLAPLELANTSEGVRVAHVDDDGIYVVSGNAIYGYNLDGSGQTHLHDGRAVALHTDGNLLFINSEWFSYARFTSIDKTTHAILDSLGDYRDSVYGSSIARGVNRIFGRSNGISPSDITYVAYNDDGQFTAGDSRYHGDYPRASRTWVFPNDAKVVDDTGTIYATSGLTRINSFATSVDDIDFYGGNIPIVLSGNTLTAYSAAIVPTGDVTLDYTPSEIFVNATSVITFTEDPTHPSGFRADIVPLAELNPPTPGQLINPVGLAYTPDKVELAADGTVLLYSKAHQSIFRWDPASQRYGATIPLIGTAEFMAYAAPTNTVYLAYASGASGLIRKIELDAAEPTEVPLATLPGRPRGLVAAGEYVFAVDRSGTDYSHYTFQPDGHLAEAVKRSAYSLEFVWNDANQKMYYFDYGLIWEQINADGVTYPEEPAGGIGKRKSIPASLSVDFDYPIRVAPDGSIVVLGSGQIHDGTTLGRHTLALANTIEDATWIGSELFTIRTVGHMAELRHWTGSTRQPLAAVKKPGTAHRLLSLPDDRLLAITIPPDGVPAFTVLNADLTDLTVAMGFEVQETAGSTSVSESGTTDTLGVVLESQPATNVEIRVNSSDPSEVVVSPEVLTFTPSDWSEPRVVTIAGVDDELVDGNLISLIRFSVNDAASDPEFHEVPDRFVGVTTKDNETGVSQLVEHNEVGYFFVANDARVERYDIANEAWLAPLELADASEGATVAHVDDDGIYVAYGRAVYRYGVDGGGQTHLLNLPDNVTAIHSDGNLLFINYSARSVPRLVSIDKTTNTILDTFEGYTSSVLDSSIAANINHIFGSSGDSTSYVNYVAYSDDGQFTAGNRRSYRGYFRASRTWVFPDDAKVVDDSGTIYATSDLTYLNSLGTSIDDIDFFGDNNSVVLAANTLTAYSTAILPTGDVTLDYTPSEISVNATSVITFTADPTLPSGFRADIVPLSELNPPTPGEPVDPVGLAYTPDKVELAADGTVLLYSKVHQSIFRWDPASQSYGATIPLIGAAEFMAYASPTNTVYLAYASGLIRKIELDAAEPTEVPFATLPDRPLGLATADEYVFAVDPSGWVRHYTFAPDGSLIDTATGKYASQEFVWSDANQKMYSFRDGVSPNDLLWEQINADAITYPDEPPGGIGHSKDSPLHGSSGIVYPIRVAPDGSIVVLGSGQIHDGTTLAPLTQALANHIDDAAWIGNELFTIRTVGELTELQHWTPSTHQLVAAVRKPGTGHRLLSLPGDQLLAITIPSGGVPAFTVLDANLDVIAPSIMATDDAYTVLENQALSGNVIGDDTGMGIDQPPVTGAILSVVAVNGDAGAVGVPVVLPSGATLTVLADGSLHYDPRTSEQLNALVSGESFVESFEYTIARRDPSFQDSAVVNITVEGSDEGFAALIDGTLIVGGTSAADQIMFYGRSSSTDVWVLVNGSRQGPFASPTRLVAFGGPGDDRINAAGAYRLPPVAFYGGAGNDQLFGGDLDDLLSGGDGHDILDGRAGSDLLIGGRGNDTLVGGAGPDRLRGGRGNDHLFGEIGDLEVDGGEGINWRHGIGS